MDESNVKKKAIDDGLLVPVSNIMAIAMLPPTGDRIPGTCHISTGQKLLAQPCSITVAIRQTLKRTCSLAAAERG